MAKTQQVALDYQAHNNLTEANTALAELEVANRNQWLLYVTENAITNRAENNIANALVKLSTDMGLQSTIITAYAEQNNLTTAASAMKAEVMVTVQPTLAMVALATNTPSDIANNIVSEEATATPNDAAAPTATSEPLMVPTETPTTITAPQLVASSDINVRSGPSTDYPIAGSLRQSEAATIIGKNTTGDWWEISFTNGQTGWVYGSLVSTAGDTNTIAVAANIPPPPATATPAPTVPPTAAPAAPAATEAPAEVVAEATPAAPAADPNAAPYFTLVSRRLWGKQENDGCVGKHLLRIHVLDANGARLNGVRLKGIYTGFEAVTGDQGKGDGIIEFDLHGSGEGFTVIRNNDGRESSSDKAEGFTTRSVDIDQETLIATGYCTNTEDCQIFYNSWGCQGHHSWEAIFQRNY
ncbi:MAG: SH3 domain-containing protein [Caldilineaceae bacterium]|nr:SH3 domain-containing protein [Caldilineaceae bacterium]